MVTSIARQSVILKCNMQKSIMLGNYEFYYGAGLIKRLGGLEISGDMEPLKMHGIILERMEELSASVTDERIKYLLKIIERYEPLEEYDEQMKELFEWGEKEPDLWQINTQFSINKEQE